jgi:murein DD-endopeptidase MepM/ murein hydrolase activator NlpD
MKEKFKAIPLLMIALVVTASIFLLGFNSNRNTEPKIIYRVYLDGKSIGAIDNKKELESYINKEQVNLKQKYNVDKVYLPVGLEIKKEMSYNDSISTAAEIYNKIKDLKPFTINGYVVTIKGSTPKKINVLNKEIFKEAVDKTIRAFVSSDTYEKFLNNNQNEITDVGKIIEDVYIEEEINIKKDNISTNEQIFANKEDLAKYLLFGTLANPIMYTVQKGDTIEKVAFNKGLSNDEFLVANPIFTDTNNLLYEGQQVSVNLISPQFSVVEERHVVEDQVKLYKTEIRYDSKMLVGNGYQLQAGIDGLDRVTKKIKMVNGKIDNAVIVSSKELKPSINRVYVKGGKVLPSIGDNSFWAWPTITPYLLTSTYGPRWGSFHEGVDISGCGYGSPIYAANNGNVYKAGYNGTSGSYVIINHNNGYYTLYAHLSKINVINGQVVQRGQIIGRMGHSGYTVGSTGTHLHFGVYRGVPFEGGYDTNPLWLYRR